MLRIKSNKAIGIIPLIITVVVLMLITGVAITALPSKDIFKFAGMQNDLIEEEEAQKNSLKQEYINSIENKITATHEELTLGDATVNVKVDTLSTINGEMYSATNPVIPAGFKAINTTTSTWYESSNEIQSLSEEVKKGLVISDESGNEFVWIPVENINNFARLQSGSTTKYRGVLYDWSSDATGQIEYTWSADIKNNREPDVVTTATGMDLTESHDALAENLSIVLEGDYVNTQTAESFKSQLEYEFTKMVQSVAKYKGFYVGRYETSMSGTTAQSTLGADPMNSTTWYNMYKNSKTYSRNNTSLGVVSEMIWGCQWDAMLKFILTGADASHVTATTNVGHALLISSPYKTGGTNYTGSSVTYADISSNIYDLEGNVNEWTQEAVTTAGRVVRGGYYQGSRSPSSRLHYSPATGLINYGSRLSLYVEVEE